MDILDYSMIKTIHDLFWHNTFYAALYVICLFALVLFGKQMKAGRRCFLLYSIICLVLFIYNPIFVNLSEKYLLNTDRVVVRIFLLLPVYYTEAYVFTTLASEALKRSRVLSKAITVALVSLLLFFGIAPWQRAEKGWGVDMYLLAENPYKIPQEHIDICDAILNDMDGERAVLSLYELRWINDIGGTLNYSIRMYTSRIQLKEVIDLESYLLLSYDDRIAYWDAYITKVRGFEADNPTLYFLFPLEDERATDLLAYGCYELPIESSNYQVLAYTPDN